jgi:hypothetical protein
VAAARRCSPVSSSRPMHSWLSGDWARAVSSRSHTVRSGSPLALSAKALASLASTSLPKRAPVANCPA